MAGENQNTGPNLAGNTDPKQLTATLKEIRQGQGDFQDSIRDSVRELNKAVSSYERMNGVLNSLKTSTININRIEKELEKSKARQVVQANKAKELEDKIGEEGKKRAENLLRYENYLKKLQSEAAKAKAIGNKEDIKAANKLLLNAENEFETLKNIITADQASYAAQLKSLNIAEQQVQLSQQYLENEKQVEKSVGATGKVLAFTSKYLGIGKDLYGKIVEEAREGEKATKKMVTAAAALGGTLGLAAKGAEKLASGISTNLTGSGGPISKLVSPFTELIGKIPVVGGLIGGLVDMLANVADYATEAGSQVQLFARNLAISREDATKINTQYSNIAHSSGNLLFNAKKFRETQLEISDALGINNLLSAESLKTQVQLKEIAGVDVETRKQLVESEKISGVSQDKIFKASVGTSAYLSKTLGVSIKWQTILKEATSLSGVLGLSFAKYPEKLTRSLATVKAMGLELKQLDGLADSFLDFESSISKEFEAQLLTGKDINLAKAREAFLNNDLVTAAKEITSQVGTASDFLNMNRIKQEALAAAMGMSKDQMADMLKQQEMFSKLQVGDVKAYQQKVALMSKTVEGQQKLISLLGEEEAQNVMRQTATESIANFIEKIKQSFADLLSSGSFKNFIDKVINFISDPKNIESMVSKITGFVSLIIKGLSYVVDAADTVVRVLSLGMADIPNSIAEGLRGYATEIGSMKLGALAPAGVSVGGRAASLTGGSSNTTATTGGTNGAQNITIQNNLDVKLADGGRAIESRQSTTSEMDKTKMNHAKK